MDTEHTIGVDSTFFTTLVEEHYNADSITLHLIDAAPSATRRNYRVHHQNGSQWILRTCRREFIDEINAIDGFPGWMMARAGTLACLQREHYPAPYVIPLRDGSLVGVYNGWCFMMTTFIAGINANYSTPALRLLSTAVGKLHAFTHAPRIGDTHSSGHSWWHPINVLQTTLAPLGTVSDLVPSPWLQQYDAFRATLQYFQRHEDLLRSIIHGDIWIGNAVVTNQDQVVLIDWECAGWGPAVLDLGSLALSCHYDMVEIQPNEQRIAAVIDGYCQERLITRGAVEALVEAVRFRPAFLGAWSFLSLLGEGWNERTEQRITRQWNRYVVSEEIAVVARRYFTTCNGLAG